MITKERRHSGRRMFNLILMILFGVTLSLPIPGSAQSYAYNHLPCHFNPNQINVLNYRFFSVSRSWELSFEAGKNAWNRAPIPGRIVEHSFHWDPEINVTDEYFIGYYGSPSDRGVTLYQCDSNGYFRGGEVEIMFNLRHVFSSTSSRRDTAIHELGHAYGLDHYDTNLCIVMRPSNLCSNRAYPTVHDIAGVLAIYGSS